MADPAPCPCAWWQHGERAGPGACRSFGADPLRR